ncbi:MAG: N-acetyltransferase [Betaproteobacteria bacterium]|nr:MAG: N-acetyltransferase [Betaproteobacteria bacterium]
MTAPAAAGDARTPSIRPLVPGDLAAYRGVRLRGLAEHPDAFSSSYEEEATPEGDARMARRLAPSPQAPHDGMLGAFCGGELVGTIGLTVDMRAKLRHRGLVVGMYVVRERARQGIGAALLAAQVDRARTIPGLASLALTVTDGNDAARRLYERAGFAVAGRDPDAVRVDGVAYDKLVMIRRLAADLPAIHDPRSTR